MKTTQLARLFEAKYSLAADASEDKLNAIRQELIDAYNNYANIASKSLKPAYNILPLLGEMGEGYSKAIIARMEDIVENIQDDANTIFTKVNDLLGVIKALQTSKRSELRNSIHDVFVARRITNVNQREQAKSKFENVVFHKLASLLEKKARSLTFLGATAVPLKGGPSEVIPKDPSQDELRNFKLSPMAVKYHFDRPEVWSKLWADLSLRRELIRIINQAKRRNVTDLDLQSDSQIMKDIQEIMDAYNAQKTNEKFFEADEGVAQQVMQPAFVSPQLKNERLHQQKMQDDVKTEEWEKLQEAVRQRDQAHQQRQIEQKKLDEDEDLQSKYSSSHLDKIFKRYQ